jgi:hypothetical protein
MIAWSLGEPGLAASILASLSDSVVMIDDSPAAITEASGPAEEAVALTGFTRAPRPDRSAAVRRSQGSSSSRPTAGQIGMIWVKLAAVAQQHDPNSPRRLPLSSCLKRC